MLDLLLGPADQAGGAVLQIRQAVLVDLAHGKIIGVDTLEGRIGRDLAPQARDQGGFHGVEFRRTGRGHPSPEHIKCGLCFDGIRSWLNFVDDVHGSAPSECACRNLGRAWVKFQIICDLWTSDKDTTCDYTPWQRGNFC